MKKAKLSKRFFGIIIDLLLIGMISMLIGIALPDKTNNFNYGKVDTKYENSDISYGSYLKETTKIDIKRGKDSIPHTTVMILITIGYFIILPRYWKGQTIGKKVLNIRIASNEEKEATIKNLTLRESLGIVCIAYEVMYLIPIIIFSSQNITHLIILLDIIFIIFLITNILSLLIRKDQRGIYELISKTRVVEV